MIPENLENLNIISDGQIEYAMMGVNKNYSKY